MFSNLKKIIFIVCGVFSLVIVKEEAVTLPSNPMYIDGGTEAGHYKKYQIKKKLNMVDNGLLVVKIPGALVRAIDGVGIKVGHPTWKTGETPKKAKIEIYCVTEAGSATRLTDVFEDGFTRIVHLVCPFFYRHAINIEDSTVQSGSWIGKVALHKDDGIDMFIAGLAEFYNASPNDSLILDVLDPTTATGIDTSPDEAEDNGAYKMSSVILDATDSTLPVYNSDTAPCGVETVGDEKVYHVPFGIGFKKPTATFYSDIPFQSYLVVRGKGTVVLEGNNTYLEKDTTTGKYLATFHVADEGKAIIGSENSLPPTNITIDASAIPAAPSATFRNSTLTFSDSFASRTVFTMNSDFTLKMLGNENTLAETVVPNNVTFNVINAKKDVGIGSSVVIEEGGRLIW